MTWRFSDARLVAYGPWSTAHSSPAEAFFDSRSLDEGGGEGGAHYSQLSII